MFPCCHPRPASRHRLGLFSIFLLSFALLVGCGGGDGQKSEDTIVLVTVGDTDITAEDYSKGLTKMEVKDLPMDENGQTVDTATLAGKQEFLEVLINKELMYQKALQLGYEKDPQAVGARASLLAYEGGLAMWEDVVGTPTNSISEEELQAFYAKMGTVRTCQFIICNFLDDAQAARDFARSGADWDEVVEKYHDGAPAPGGKHVIKIPFGQYSPSFEDRVFETPVGDVTEPIQTSYGYWVMRVTMEKEGPKRNLEEAKAEILDVARNRKIGKIRNEFTDQMRIDHKMVIDEDVLWICYQGLPEGGLMDPETNQPRGKETLEPLNVPLSELDRFFYSYVLKGETTEHTLGDYKGHFDKMSVFQRPKKSDMLGGLREHIISELSRGFLNEEVEKRGYHDDPRVEEKVNAKVEEIMVTKLYSDVVTYDERVTSEDMDSFYQEHMDEFKVPETRSGLLVICLNEAEAGQAKTAAEQGMPWSEVVKKYGTDRENKSRGGKVAGVTSNRTDPVKEALFNLEADQFSMPFLVNNGRYGVVKLLTIEPARLREKSEVLEGIGHRIKSNRKEEAFQALLAKWSAEFGVTEYPENLEGLPSWEELHTRVVPENLVPRN